MTDIIYRTNILDNLITVIQGIDQRDGYNFNIGQDSVSKILKSAQAVTSSDLPMLFISDGPETMIYEMGSRVGNHFNVIIRGIVEDENNPSGELNKLIADVSKAILVDPKRGTDSNGNPNAGNTKILRISTDQGLASPRAIFEMEIETVYYTLDQAR